MVSETGRVIKIVESLLGANLLSLHKPCDAASEQDIEQARNKCPAFSLEHPRCSEWIVGYSDPQGACGLNAFGGLGRYTLGC